MNPDLAPPRRACAAYTEEDDRVADLLGFRPALAVRPGVCFAYADRYRGVVFAVVGFTGSLAVLLLAALSRVNMYAPKSPGELLSLGGIIAFDGWAAASAEAWYRHFPRSHRVYGILLFVGLLAVQWGWAYALARSARRLTRRREWPWVVAAPLFFNALAFVFDASTIGDFFQVANGRIAPSLRAAAWSALGLLVVLEIAGRLLRRRAGTANGSSARAPESREAKAP